MVHFFTARPTITCSTKHPPHPLFVCNGEMDCSDGVDEKNCTQGECSPLTFEEKPPCLYALQTFDLPDCEISETSCSAIRYQCRSGSCILKKNAKCDNIPDCRDNSDEDDCGENVILGNKNALL